MRDLNFFEGIKKPEVRRKMGKFLRNGIIVLVCCALLVGGAYGWLYLQKNTAEKAAQTIDEQMQMLKASSPDYEALTENRQKLTALKTYNSIIEQFTTSLGEYPHVDHALFTEIYAKMPADVHISRVQYGQGVLAMECTAQNASSPADFVRNLRSAELISEVGYNGYFAENTAAVLPEGETAGGTVSFTVSCVLKGGSVQ